MTTRTWSDAQKWCESNGGNLASVHDVTENQFVLSKLTQDSYSYWIGLYQGRNSIAFLKWPKNCPEIGPEMEL